MNKDEMCVVFSQSNQEKGREDDDDEEEEEEEKETCMKNENDDDDHGSIDKVESCSTSDDHVSQWKFIDET
jgi:hypothetical protein